MSLAKLTAISTKTLSLILERQRLQGLPSYSSNGNPNGSSLHYPQIKRNLNQLREGIFALETKEGSSTDATKLLRSQYERMRSMLWEEEQTEIPRSVYLEFNNMRLTSNMSYLASRTARRPHRSCYPRNHWRKLTLHAKTHATPCCHNPHLHLTQMIQNRVLLSLQSLLPFFKCNGY